MFRYFMYLVVISYAFWALPFIPGTYSSATHFILLFLLPLLVFKKFSYGSVSLYFIVLTVFVFGFLGSVLFYLPNWFEFISWLVLLFSVVCMKMLIEEVGLNRLFISLGTLGKVLIVVGIVELLSKYVVGPQLWFSAFGWLGAEYSSRVVLFTKESSWAMLQLISLFPFVVFSCVKRNGVTERRLISFWLMLLAILIVFSYSMTAYITIFLSLAIYVILFRLRFLFLGMVGVMVSVLLLSLVSYGGDAYYASRFDKIQDVLLQDASYTSLMHVDGSLLVRLGYPYMALQMFLDNPFGYGPGGFAIQFKEYLHLLPYYTSEVLSHAAMENADPRNFFLEVLVCFGVFGLGVFLYLILIAYRSVLGEGGIERNLLSMLFSLVLVVMLQFTTPYFGLYVFFFAISLSKYREKNSSADS